MISSEVSEELLDSLLLIVCVLPQLYSLLEINNEERISISFILDFIESKSSSNFSKRLA